MITGLPFTLTADSPLVTDTRFHSLLVPQHSQAVASGGRESDDTQAVRAMLKASLPTNQLIDEACKLVNKQMAHALGPAAGVEETKPLSTYGIDSLAAVDLRTWFKVRLGAELTTLDVLNASNLRFLSSKVVENSWGAFKLQEAAQLGTI